MATQQRLLQRPSRRTLLDVVRDQGRTLAWLARRSGYSERHVRRVAHAEHPGTRTLHARMMELLGEEYDLPEELVKPARRARGRALRFGETFLPKGVFGANTLAALMEAQGIRRPQALPRERPKAIDDEAMRAFRDALKELGR